MGRLCAGLLFLTATAWAEVPTATSAVPEILKELRKIESATYRPGAADGLRVDYQALVRTRPADPLLRVLVAWCSSLNEDAWNQLKGIVSVNPDFVWAHYGMARIYLGWKMRDQARSELELVLKRDPKFYPAIVVQGDLARALEDHAKAEGYYRAALALAEDPAARSGLGLSLLALGKPGEAQIELRRSIDAWPDQPVALTALVKLLTEADDPAAANVLERLLELEPRNRTMRKQLAELRFKAGDHPSAAKEYERLFRLGNPEVELARRLATIYREAKDLEGEERTLTLVSSLDRASPEAALRLSDLWFERGDIEAARGQALEALSRDPKRADGHLRLATYAAKGGTMHEALEHYRAAAALGSGEGKSSAAKLEADFRPGKTKARGTVEAINWSVASSLEKFFQERLSAKRDLGGVIKARVRVAKDGRVEAVELVEDTVGDPNLAGHVYLRLRDAEFPKQKREPVFEFELGKRKK